MGHGDDARHADAAVPSTQGQGQTVGRPAAHAVALHAKARRLSPEAAAAQKWSSGSGPEEEETAEQVHVLCNLVSSPLQQRLSVPPPII